MLADQDIVRAIGDGLLTIDPVEVDQIQPASVDLRLDDTFEALVPGREYMDPAEDMTHAYQRITVPAGNPLTLHPGECVLGSTIERVALPDDLVGRVEGKSSLGRLFLLVHVTAGYIDPGFAGHITLELVNLGPRPFRLWPGMRICQLSLQPLTSPAAAPYGSAPAGSHYQDQPRGPVLSRSFERFRTDTPEGTP